MVQTLAQDMLVTHFRPALELIHLLWPLVFGTINTGTGEDWVM